MKTPRTDARFASGSYASKVEFARQLERELNEAKAELNEIKHNLANYAEASLQRKLIKELKTEKERLKK